MQFSSRILEGVVFDKEAVRHMALGDKFAEGQVDRTDCLLSPGTIGRL